MSTEQKIDIHVQELEEHPARLDIYLACQLPGLTRSRIQKLIDQGLVLLSGKPAKAGTRLRGGEKLTVTIPAEEPLELEPQAIPLKIVYEDDYLLVVDKPAGMVTHPGAGVKQGTLVNALLHHCRGTLSGISGVLRPGIVHRLDKDTSGLMVVAKEDRAFRGLAQQIHDRQARRTYLALVEGVMPEDSGCIEKPIGRHPVHRQQMAVVERGRHAVTRFTVLRRFAGCTLVSVELETGRTHQIRVHMASLGFPVVGDIVYNRKATGTLAKRHKLGLVGHALHATRLSFRHPVSGSLLEFEAPLPADFQRLLEALKEER
ncbi:MAG TPA: RluA family pseudouridine synthase [Candidatus Obscuribacterales bacterium]